MSHKTGKRVLTASTTLAMAAVGLASMPAHAITAAALGQATYANACGTTADTVTVPSSDGYFYFTSADGGANKAQITDADGNGKLDYTLVAGTDYGSADLVTGVKKLKSSFAVYGGTLADGSDAVAVIQVGADTINDTKCTITVGEAQKPAVIENANGTVGGSIVLKKVDGVQYTVTQGPSTGAENPVGTYKSSAMSGDTTVAISSKMVQVVTATEVADMYTLNPPTTTWTLTLDGYADIALPIPSPVMNDSSGTANDTVSLPSIPNVEWRMTTASVGSLAAAQAGVLAAGDWHALSSGTNYYFTAVAINNSKFADGAAYKTFGPYNFSGQTIVDLKLTDIVFQDKDGSINDGILVPSVDGATFYYKCAGTAPAAVSTATGGPGGNTVVSKADMITAGGWTEITTEGRLVTLAPSSDKCTVQAVLDDPMNSVFKTSSTDPAYLTSTALTAAKNSPNKSMATAFTATTVIVPAVPSAVDGSGTADSITFPTFDPRLDYYYKVSASSVAPGAATPTAGQLGTASYVKVMDSSWSGKTVTRDQWGTVFGLDFPPKTATYPSGIDYMRATDLYVGIAAVIKDSTSFTFGANAPDQQLKPWVSHFTIGATAAAVSPTFQDLSGTASDGVIYNAVSGIEYYYSTVDFATAATAAVNGTASALVPADWYGRLRLVAPGTTLYVVAKAASGSTLSNPDAIVSSVPVKYYSHKYTADAVVAPGAPSKVADLSGTAHDTYMVPSIAGVEYYVDGIRIDPVNYGKALATGGKGSLVITARPTAGNTFPSDAVTSWTLTFDTTAGVGDVGVGNTIISATPPTAKFEWGADNATSYTVTYHKVLDNGASGPELPWLVDTTQTSANFVAMVGDKYTITVTATNDAGDEKSASSTVAFPAPNGTGLVDIKPGNGTFGGSWDNLTNLMGAHNLPYFGDTAALGYTNSSWTVTLPAGSRSFDLYATVHKYGSKGVIQVNGANWADFNTNSGYWGPVSDPYKYPVRTVSGWNPNQVVTIKVIVTENSANYVALDAYQAHK